MDLGLRGKVALVTGASRGIGLSITSRLGREGCRLGICARDLGRLNRVAAELRAEGIEVVSVAADVLDPGQAAQFVERCADELGGIDVLINNVGGSVGGSLMEATDEDWRQSFELSVFQLVRLIRLAVPQLRRDGGGTIVNIASFSGWRTQLGGGPQYGAAKAAVIFMTEHLALELARDQIRVNTISPGSVLLEDGYWDRVRQQQPEAFAAYARDGFPMGRLGQPDEVAAAVAFIASPQAYWINGRNIPVDGLQQPAPWNAAWR
jgi:3-oxoacyl-[acyl-carrier protein] reductase